MFKQHPLLKPFTCLKPNYFPEKELKAAIVHQEEVTPLLISALNDYFEDPVSYGEQEGNCLHIVALTLLAQFRIIAALPPLLSIIRSYDSGDEQGDFPYDDLLFSIPEDEFSRILATLARKNIACLGELVLDNELDYYMRCRALAALKSCYYEGDIKRAEFIHFLSSLFDTFKTLEKETDDYVFLWGELFEVCLAIHPGELMDKIKVACEEGVFEGISEPYQHMVETCNRQSFDQWLTGEGEILKQDYGYICDAVTDLDEWGMNQYDDPFSDDAEDFLRAKVQQRALLNGQAGELYNDIFHKSSDGSFIREEPKTGRNDPCPCGSGKKFKKCCGR